MCMLVGRYVYTRMFNGTEHLASCLYSHVHTKPHKNNHPHLEQPLTKQQFNEFFQYGKQPTVMNTYAPLKGG